MPRSIVAVIATSQRTSFRALAAWVGLFTALGLPALATAAEPGSRPKVLVVPLGVADDVPEGAGGKIAALLIEELKKREGVVLVASGSGGGERASPRSDAGPRKVKEARALIDAGKKQTEELRFDDAAKTLKQAADLLTTPGIQVDLPTLSECYLAWAVAAFRADATRVAQDALTNLARLDPLLTLGDAYPPVFVREWDKAKRRLEKITRSSLVIEGPSGSTVFLDGKDLGMVPVTEEGLPLGWHHVRVEGPKKEQFAQLVEVRPVLGKVKAAFDGSGTVPTAAMDPHVGATLDEAALARVTEAAAAAGAEMVVVGYVSRLNDAQLSVGVALVSARAKAAVSLGNSSIDADVLTANVEAYKLSGEIEKRAGFTGEGAKLPIVLSARKSALKPSVATKPVESDARTNEPARTALKPSAPPAPSSPTVTVNPPLAVKTRPLDAPTPVNVDPTDKPVHEPFNSESEIGTTGTMPTWVWVSLGVAAAAGAGIATGFAVAAALKPVTGTVVATW